MASMADHVRAMLAFQAAGAVTFDYGNNIRAQAQAAGVANAFDFPGFVPAFIRPLFCEGKGPFRWAALSGDPEDILRTDEAILRPVPGRRRRCAAGSRWPRPGCRSRACRRGSAGSATASGRSAGAAFNELVRIGEVSAPIVIGRDHLDSGSVASPNRETEAMRDGSDAIADWPLLNALVNTAAGATWVSIHHGGGTGIGYQPARRHGRRRRRHATSRRRSCERVLTTDPAMGVIRHADAGYERAIEVAEERRRPCAIPMLTATGSLAGLGVHPRERASGTWPGRQHAVVGLAGLQRRGRRRAAAVVDRLRHLLGSTGPARTARTGTAAAADAADQDRLAEADRGRRGRRR